jgi:hypothetical protein
MRGCRRLLMLVGGLVLACALAACGSASSGSSVSNPLATELSYLPPNSPLVAAIATDPNSASIKSANALLARFQLGSLLVSALKQKLQQQGINYDTDIKPLFGNPAVLAGLSATLTATTNSQNFVAVWITHDADKLNALVTKPAAGLSKIGTHAGATLYRSHSGNTVAAIDGPTLVVADTQAQVDAALDRHANGGGMTQAQYSQEVGGLPASPLLEVFGNVKASLANSNNAAALRVPWVAAITSYALSMNATSTGFSLDWRVNTNGRQLSASQLPFAAGTSAPNLASGGSGSFAIRDPAQLFSFFESTLQAADPAAYSRLLSGVSALRGAAGVDFNRVVALLTGDLITGREGASTVVRAGVSDPKLAAQTLATLQRHPNLHMTPVGGGFYTVQSQGKTVTVGIVGSQFVAGAVSAAQLRAFATAPTVPSGGHGAIVFRASLSQSLGRIASLVRSPQAQAILSQLGQFSGWMGVTPSALTGDATVTVK